eukprot:gene30342-35342_t
MVKRSRVSVEVKEDVAAPFVGYFPTGNPSADGSGTDVTFSVYEGKGTMGRGLLVGSKGNVDYVGTSAGQEYTGPQPCSYAVAVYDKVKGKLEVMPVQWSKVLRLEARLRSLDYGTTGAGAEEYAANDYDAKRADNKRLVDSFGSTRRRRQLVSMEEGRVKVERLSATDHLTQVITEGADIARKAGFTKEEIMKKAMEKRVLPPHHPEGKTPMSAYNLDDIIPTGGSKELELNRLQEAVKSGETPVYVLSRVHLLLHTNPDLAKYKSKALGLLWERPTTKTELLNAYIIVTAMLAEVDEDGRCVMGPTEFEALRLELKMTSPDLMSRFRETGATQTAVKLQNEDGSVKRTYSMSLLSDRTSVRDLAASFPGLKMRARAK